MTRPPHVLRTEWSRFTPALMNALVDALRPNGIIHLDMPATPARVWQALRDAAR